MLIFIKYLFYKYILLIFEFNLKNKNMKKVNLIILMLVFLLSCKKDNISPEKKPETSKNFTIKFNTMFSLGNNHSIQKSVNDKFINKYQIIFIPEIGIYSNDTLIVCDSTKIKLNFGSYNITANSLPKKMSWNNRNEFVFNNKIYPSWESNTNLVNLTSSIDTIYINIIFTSRILRSNLTDQEKQDLNIKYPIYHQFILMCDDYSKFITIDLYNKDYMTMIRYYPYSRYDDYGPYTETSYSFVPLCQ